MKVDQKCCLEPLPHVFCGLKIQGKDIELKIHIDNVSECYNIDNWKKRGGKDEMVLAAPCLNKATEC